MPIDRRINHPTLKRNCSIIEVKDNVECVREYEKKNCGLIIMKG